MSEVTVDTLRAALQQRHPETAPMMRWWWFGPAVERAELDRQLRAMADAGLGGAEVSFVYPLEEATTTFCSPDMLADLRWTAERARELGLRLDVTLGSGWSFGGPHIDADLAARGIRFERHETDMGGRTAEVGAAWPGDVLVAAYLAPGSAQEPTDGWAPLPVVTTPTGWAVEIPAGSGTRQLLLAWSRLTGQQVKRAAAGAEGPVLDHYSEAATSAHLRAVGDPLLDAVDPALLGSVFCDSLEVYHADWTPDLPAEFERRRGYPLLPDLPLLQQGDDARARRFRTDYHHTLVDLYEERFVAVVQRWAAGRGVPFRLQGYGAPPATLSSYRFADAFEGEGWGWTELTATRWASSAAHHYGRGVVSAEAWTWVRSPSLRATPLDLAAEAHEHLLNGVTLLIGHGWPYSPTDADGVGWLFYAAGCLDDRNPWWAAMPSLSRYLERLGWLLQQGEGVRDVAVYVPTDDLLAQISVARGGSLDTWREANAVVGPEVLGPVRRAGLDYDLSDDDVVAHTDLRAPAVVLVPAATDVPARTRAWLEAAAAAGSTVLLVDAAVEIAGARAVTAGDLPGVLRDVVATPFVEDAEVGLVHRRLDGIDVRFLASTVATPTRVQVRADGPWERWDPATSTVLDTGTGDVEVALEPYQATLLVSGPGVVPTPVASAPTTASLALADGWTVAADDGTPVPVTLPHVWEEQPALAGFSGALRYRCEVEVPADAVGRVVLDLGESVALHEGASPRRGMVGPSFRAAVRGPVGEVARVLVNGQDLGVLWAPPFRVGIGAALRPGRNTIELEVANTGANALAHDQHVAARVARTEERYGRRFVMQQLDRALDDVASGLLAVPTLRW